MRDIGTVLAFRLDKFHDQSDSHYLREYIALKIAILKKDKNVSNSFELEVHEVDDENQSIGVLLPSKCITRRKFVHSNPIFTTKK